MVTGAILSTACIRTHTGAVLGTLRFPGLSSSLKLFVRLRQAPRSAKITGACRISRDRGPKRCVRDILAWVAFPSGGGTPTYEWFRPESSAVEVRMITDHSKDECHSFQTLAFSSLSSFLR